MAEEFQVFRWRVTLVAPAVDQSLPEYCVGQMSRTCVYPGIAQCFAIAGWKNGDKLCTHVSPGATKGGIHTTFEYLRDMGRDLALRWYVTGPSQVRTDDIRSNAERGSFAGIGKSTGVGELHGHQRLHSRGESVVAG